MPWSTLGPQHFGADVILTSPTVQALYNNPIGIANGDSGAPRIQNAGLADNCIDGRTLNANAVSDQSHMVDGFVRRLKLHTTNQQVSRSGAGVTHFALAGGAWHFWPSLSIPGSGSIITAPAYQAGATGGNDAFSARMTMSRTDTGTQTAFLLYIPASPPYDLGDGEVAAFAYAAVAPDGTVSAFSIAPDPPWTSLTEGPNPAGEFLAGRIDRAEMMRQVKAKKAGGGPRDKLAGMDRLPQPILYHEPNHPVIIFDPVSEIVRDLMEIAEAEGNVAALLAAGNLRIDNDKLDKRKTPPGVPAHAVRWSNTR